MSHGSRFGDTASRDGDRIVRSWLHEDRHEDATRVLDTVLTEVDTTPQRSSGGTAWRFSLMNNNIVRVGLAAAAVVVIAIIAINLLPGSPTPGGEPSTSPSAAPSEAAQSAEPSTWTGIAAGPFVVADTDAPVPVTVEIASPGWGHDSGIDYLYKDPEGVDDGSDSPEANGALLIAWSWPAGTGINVYGDPCNWSFTTPATPATTPDEIAEALTAQAEVEATTPVDVTVGGYAGKTVTLTVPMTYHQEPDVSREVEFAECDQAIYGFYAAEGMTEPERNAQGPGQIDELWILDVDGAIVILDVSYSPATPAELVEETRAMAESATFEAP
jgi:hypothetical protein